MLQLFVKYIFFVFCILAGTPTFMLSLRGVEVDVLRKMIATTNKSLQLPSSAQMEISLINGPTSHVVSGAPQLLTELLLDLMEPSAGKNFKNYYYCCGCCRF